MLIPVVDDYLAWFLTGKRGTSLSHRSMTHIIFDQFRPQLIANLAALSDVRSRLNNPGLTLTNCRILDIAIWTHCDDNKLDYGLRSS